METRTIENEFLKYLKWGDVENIKPLLTPDTLKILVHRYDILDANTRGRYSFNYFKTTDWKDKGPEFYDILSASVGLYLGELSDYYKVRKKNRLEIVKLITGMLSPDYLQNQVCPGYIHEYYCERFLPPIVAAVYHEDIELIQILSKFNVIRNDDNPAISPLHQLIALLAHKNEQIKKLVIPCLNINGFKSKKDQEILNQLYIKELLSIKFNFGVSEEASKYYSEIGKFYLKLGANLSTIKATIYNNIKEENIVKHLNPIFKLLSSAENTLPQQSKLQDAKSDFSQKNSCKLRQFQTISSESFQQNSDYMGSRGDPKCHGL